MDVALLGPLTVTQGGSLLELTGPKRKALFIYLALHAGTPVSRDRLVEVLWPGERTGREDSTLRVHVSHLRDVIEPERGEARILVTHGSAYMLSTDHLDLDVNRFERLCREGRELLTKRPEAAIDRFDAALALWHGRPLVDVEYEEFAQEEIRRLEAARTEALEDRAEALVEAGEDAAAVEDLETLVRAEPTRERPVLLLMTSLYRTGRQADAMRVARRHARHLAERGLEPSPRVRLLEDRILGHDPTLLPDGLLSPSDIAPGRSIRGYELRAEVGSGAFGIVFRAFQSSVGREVAVKVVHPHLAESPEFVRRFAEEARVVASLEHPHIVPLHDHWREPAGAFLVMRWMDGGSLADRVGASWEMGELGRTFSQLAGALGYAHQAGVIHRGLKPSNVLFDSGGNAYLCDFGLAVPGDGIVARAGTSQPPYASPEMMRGEPPSPASDIYSLGVMLGEAAAGIEELREVVSVATAPDPADRYPDMEAFAVAIREAIGPVGVPAPRRVRRNPYKGLAPFGESDRADFYGRDDLVETLVHMVDWNRLTAIIGASGSGKSSLVLAGLIPELRSGALPGSEEWSVVTMVPGTDPFEEFHLGVRQVAVAHESAPSREPVRELRQAFDVALDGPAGRAVLVVDQFEEVFSSEVDESTRRRFLDNLVDLASDASRRVRVVVTLRADFSDRPLAHPRFGDLLSRGSLLVGPMRPEQVDDVIRRPASRVGIQVEPGLVAEIVRDVSDAPAYLPLLQYVLSELFERRTEDRLTVQAYRQLGGVEGVLERRAEATYSGLPAGARQACRQLFLRMVHLGDHGEETRRRLPLTELQGLGARADVDEALSRFSEARLLTFDRDPVSRVPTVEVAHETVIARWTRYRVWIDEARADIRAHRRLAAAAATWAGSEEDPAYLLTAGPLAASLDLADDDRVHLNDVERRFLEESRSAHEAAEAREVERRRRESELQSRARRRLLIGVAAGLVAVTVAVLGSMAWLARRRADDLAATRERESMARELAAASVNLLNSADPELPLLLAIGAADATLDAGEDILPEAIDALHRAVINPGPSHITDGAGSGSAGQALDVADNGSVLAALAEEGGVMLLDPESFDVIAHFGSSLGPAQGLDVASSGEMILTHYRDAIREWDVDGRVIATEFDLGALGLDEDVRITTAVYSRDASAIGVGASDGTITVVYPVSGDLVRLSGGHSQRVRTLAFDPSGTRLVSGSQDTTVRIWDISTGEWMLANTDQISFPILAVAWHPVLERAVVTTLQAENFLVDTLTGERVSGYGFAESRSRSLSLDSEGTMTLMAGSDGSARVYGTAVGGAPVVEYPTGGVPLQDADWIPGTRPSLHFVTVDAAGQVRAWTADNLRSELPATVYPYLYPTAAATRDGSCYVVSAYELWTDYQAQENATVEVIDAATGESVFSHHTERDWDTGRGAAISDDCTAVAFPAPGGDVLISNIDTGEAVEIRGSGCWTASLAFRHDGTLLAGGGYDGTIALWDTKNGARVGTFADSAGSDECDLEAIKRFPFVPGRITELMFRPGGSELVSARADGAIQVWDLESHSARIIDRFDFEARSVQYSKDGALIGGSDRSGTVRVWDADSGDLVLEPERLPGDTRVTFSPDGRYLAGAGPEYAVHLWDLGQGPERGRIVRRLFGSFYDPTSVVFVNGGAEIRAMDGSGVDRGYLLDPLDLLELARSEVTRALTEEECERYLDRSCEG